MNARFFYAGQSFNTWPKLFVLTQDGTFYSEYLDHMNPRTINKKVDYQNFKETDYSYEGYQKISEVSYEEARSKSLTRQSNWVDSYLRRQGLL